MKGGAASGGFQQNFDWSSSSSIGKNSDDEGIDDEVQSPYKGPLDMMESLEQVLPIRRGISKFYKGKSKSFKNLMESTSIPMKNLGKPENAFNRRQRIVLAHRIMCTRNRITKKSTAMVIASASYPPNPWPRHTEGSFGKSVPGADFDSPHSLPKNI